MSSQSPSPSPPSPFSSFFRLTTITRLEFLTSHIVSPRTLFVFRVFTFLYNLVTAIIIGVTSNSSPLPLIVTLSYLHYLSIVSYFGLMVLITFNNWMLYKQCNDYDISIIIDHDIMAQSQGHSNGNGNGDRNPNGNGNNNKNESDNNSHVVTSSSFSPSSSPSLLRTSSLMKFTWILFSLLVPISLMVTIVYWSLLFPAETSHSYWSTLHMHAFNTAMCMGPEFIMNRFLLIPRHTIFLVIISIIYLTFGIIIHETTGHWIYNFLNYSSNLPLTAFTYPALILFVVSLFLSMYIIQKILWKKCYHAGGYYNNENNNNNPNGEAQSVRSFYNKGYHVEDSSSLLSEDYLRGENGFPSGHGDATLDETYGHTLKRRDSRTMTIVMSGGMSGPGRITVDEGRGRSYSSVDNIEMQSKGAFGWLC